MVERWISGYGMDLVGDRLNSAGVKLYQEDTCRWLVVCVAMIQI